MFRALVMGKNGLVSSAHPLATQAGLKLLQDGGNAWEAAITISAVLGVVHSHLSGLGGDLLILQYSARQQEYNCLNASGRSPLAADIDRLNRLGYSRMPRRGALAVTVPGCVSAWDELKRKYGQLSWQRILQPAVEYAREGFPIGQYAVETLDSLRDLVRHDPGLREIFSPGGNTLQPGELIKQKDLAAVLEGIVQNGAAWFYEGAPARLLGEYMAQKGALLAEEDFTDHTVAWSQPLSCQYGDYSLYQTPPNSQGLAELLALNILDGLDFAALGCDSPQLIHYLVEAKKIACQYREQYITDPEFVPLEYDELLDKQFAARLRKMIVPGQVGGGPNFISALGWGECFIVADREGNIVCGAQGLHSPLGAGFIAPETGIILQSSCSSFSLDPGHINRLEPQKRPSHMLTPTIVALKGKPIYAVGVAGGEAQLQVQLQLLNKLLNSGFNLQEAIERPRWFHGGAYPGDPALYLQMEGRFSLDEIGELESWGHNVRTIDDWAWQTGEAQAVRMDAANGVFQAGSDPRGESMAAAY